FRREAVAARRHDLVGGGAGDELDEPALVAVAGLHERLAVGFAEQFGTEVEAVAGGRGEALGALEAVGGEEGIGVLAEIEGAGGGRRQAGRLARDGEGPAEQADSSDQQTREPEGHHAGTPPGGPAAAAVGASGGQGGSTVQCTPTRRNGQPVCWNLESRRSGGIGLAGRGPGPSIERRKWAVP